MLPQQEVLRMCAAIGTEIPRSEGHPTRGDVHKTSAVKPGFSRQVCAHVGVTGALKVRA